MCWSHCIEFPSKVAVVENVAQLSDVPTRLKFDAVTSNLFHARGVNTILISQKYMKSYIGRVSFIVSIFKNIIKTLRNSEGALEFIVRIFLEILHASLNILYSWNMHHFLITPQNVLLCFMF